MSAHSRKELRREELRGRINAGLLRASVYLYPAWSAGVAKGSRASGHSYHLNCSKFKDVLWIYCCKMNEIHLELMKSQVKPGHLYFG